MHLENNINERVPAAHEMVPRVVSRVADVIIKYRVNTETAGLHMRI